MTDEPDPPEEHEPDFGPSGYLPGRAARRARKIVLRAPLGAQWIVASILAGVVVLVAGLVFFTTRDAAPRPPYVPVGPVESLEAATYFPRADALVVAPGGRIRAFAHASELGLRYCAPARQLEGTGGEVWTLTGRGHGGSPSLKEHPTTVHDGILYVDPSRFVTGPSPLDETADPVCGAGTDAGPAVGTTAQVTRNSSRASVAAMAGSWRSGHLNHSM